MSRFNVESMGNEAAGPGAAWAARVACVCVLLLVGALFAACGDGEDQDDAPPPAQTTTSAPKSDEGSIKADPNPVPAGAGNGKTTISWTTKGNLGVVKVYVSENGQPETEFSQKTEGSAEAPWIGAGSTYEFRLYAEQGPARRLIDKVVVTRNRS